MASRARARQCAWWLLVVFFGAAGCTSPAREGQLNFRVRSDFSAGLNADAGWAGALNENVTIAADRPFRLRFEVPRAGAASAGEPLRLQYRRNGGDWTGIEAHEFPYSNVDDPKTPRVSVITCAAYAHGTPTTNVLAGSAAPFQPGVGVSLTGQAAVASGASTHTEVEWALVVRRFADGAVTNDEGDTFEFRMIDAGRPQADTARNPVLRLQIPPGHVGGTYVETPGRIGPWQSSNGHLYFIMEPAESDNVFMMMKSADGGRTWREVDAAHRPATDDLESVDSRLVGDTIHIVHQVTRSVRYHTFRTADHPTHPDTWDIRDEVAGTVTAVAQAASLVVRSDRSVVAFYVGDTIHYGVRAPGGGWSAPRAIDRGLRLNLAGPQAVLGTNDTVHLAYYGVDGTIWYRRLERDGALTPGQPIATGAGTTRAVYGAVLPLIFIRDTNTVVLLYRLADGRLWERRVVNEGTPTPAVRVADRAVVTDAVDSQQPGADAVLDAGTVHVLFIDDATRSIFSTDDRGGWNPPVRRVHDIRGQWVRGNVYTRPDGRRVYGYIYDAGSNGGSGMNRYDELAIAAP